MLIDFHTHIFPPDIQQHRERYCARDPWFDSLYSNPRSRIATAEDLIAEMDETGVDVSVTFSFGWTDTGLIEETNDYVIDAMRRYPKRIYGMAVFEPSDVTFSIPRPDRRRKGRVVGP